MLDKYSKFGSIWRSKGFNYYYYDKYMIIMYSSEIINYIGVPI